MENMAFQALHCPVGANASFALGLPGSGGGFGLEQDRVPTQDVFIGLEKEGRIFCFPYYAHAVSAAVDSFVQTSTAEEEGVLRSCGVQDIRREYRYGSDTFEAGPLRFSIATPVRPLPDPAVTPADRMEEAVCPALAARLTVDNRGNPQPVRAFFMVSPMKGMTRLSDATAGQMKGMCSKDGYGFGVRNEGESLLEAADFDLPALFGRRHPVMLTIAPMGGLLFTVPADTQKTFELVLGWYRAGAATGGEMRCTYLYTRYFPSLEAVLRYGLTRSRDWWEAAEESSRLLERSALSPERRFLVTHSVRAYAASTMLLDHGGDPLWVVNEGSYMMMGTLDLSVDHCFFELQQNPWVVKNQLELFADRYSYYDQCGIAFCHDCGTHQVFTPAGNSSYEIPNLRGCFSYMSQEQLCNWILMAGMYMERTKDAAWHARRLSLFRDCLHSMTARTGGRPDGIQHVDSSRCGDGWEITTYDSLDPSLGQSRENLYIAMKCWAAYLCLEKLLRDADPEEAGQALACAQRCARTVVSSFREDGGYIPAILDGKDRSAIIPAIEPLVYAVWIGERALLEPGGMFGELARTLRRHLETVLVKGVCLFPDGGFRLSANNTNSWMSKIFLCQYVAQEILGVPVSEEADRAHAAWWAVNTASCPAIDQILAGRSAETGFHYPRGVTTALWW